MKKLLLILAMAILIAAPAMADWLVCDAPPVDQNVTYYKVIDNSVELSADHPAEADGSLRYDLGVIDAAKHTYEAVACNMRGCSEVSDPFVLSSLAGKPQNTRWIK